MEPETFSKMLYDARKRRQMSQGELASLAGVKSSYICRIERGQSACSLELAFKLERILGLDTKLSDMLIRALRIKAGHPNGHDQVASNIESAYKTTEPIPHLSHITQDFRDSIERHAIRWYSVPRVIIKSKQCFIFSVNHNTGASIGIHSGDLMLCNYDRAPVPGDIVLLFCPKGYFFSRFVLKVDRNRVFLDFGGRKKILRLKAFKANYRGSALYTFLKPLQIS